MKKILSIFIVALGLSSLEVNAARWPSSKNERTESCKTCGPCGKNTNGRSKRLKPISKGSCCNKNMKRTKRSCSNGKCNI